MKQNTIKIIVILVGLVLVALAGQYGFTVVSLEDEAQSVQDATFDAATWVEGIWESRVVKAYEETTALSAILSKMEPDANGNAAKDNLIEVTNEYGLITVGESHVYKVNGSGKIVAADLESSRATIEVALDGYSGPIKVLIYVGTRVAAVDSFAVRDSSGIVLGEFKEQTQYNQVASEINKRIIANILTPLNKDNMVGKTVNFKGAFSISTFNQIAISLKEINIVPVEIEVVE